MFALALLHTDGTCDRTVSYPKSTTGPFPEGTLPNSDTDHLRLSNAVG